jgi:hypothetical protein
MAAQENFRVRITCTNELGSSWSYWLRLTKTGKVTAAHDVKKAHTFDRQTALEVMARDEEYAAKRAAKVPNNNTVVRALEPV